MPSSEHAVQQRRGSGSGKYQIQQEGKAADKGRIARKAIPVDLNDNPHSLFSPILSHLPSLSSIPSLGAVQHSQDSEGLDKVRIADKVRASWHTTDLGDGLGRSPLLVKYDDFTIQIYRFSHSTIPDDPHVKERFDEPKELFSISRIHSGLTEGGKDFGKERIVDVRFSEASGLKVEHGPVIVVLLRVQTPKKSLLRVALVSLREGKVIRNVMVGEGGDGSICVSRDAIALALSEPLPSIQLLHPGTLEPIMLPLIDVAINPNTRLPVLALSGRLLAFTTSEAPFRPGPDGLGSVITSTNSTRSKSFDNAQSSRSPQAPSQDSPGKISTQAAIMSTATDIGGGVARGVWAGIKMGARVANQARVARLARSAPTEAVILADSEAEATIETEPRSLDNDSVLDASSRSTMSMPLGGEWIKIIDLRSRIKGRTDGAGNSRSQSPQDRSNRRQDVSVIAHFRCPVRSLTSSSLEVRYSQTAASSSAVSRMMFNHAGTQLVVGPEDGKSLHLFEIHPHASKITPNDPSVRGEAWHLYELRRGNTPAKVHDMSWSLDGRWIGVATGRGTIHVFPIVPTGGPVSASTHLCGRNINPQRLYPLSTVVSAAARLRPPEIGSTVGDQKDGRFTGPGISIFDVLQSHPLQQGVFCQDAFVFRPDIGVAELVRLELSSSTTATPDRVVGQRRPSALTEMMRAKTGLLGTTDLAVKKLVKARWTMPTSGEFDTDLILAEQTKPPNSRLPASLSQAEIQTYCSHPQVSPGTIYLSRQIDFSAARPIDDFSPLSIMDTEARTKRLLFRSEVEARPASSEVRSFDEPLMTAIHTAIEGPSSSPIPGLPNGYPGQSRWRSIPIRNVAANLGEGVDRVRREYVRAQHSRARRRASEAIQNGLSFEDETVFEIRAGNGDEDDEGSSPSSALLPTTNTESSVDDDEWGEGWEAEYAKAVEDDGAPEELVLGLMDEEEEERRCWALKQKERTRR